MDRFLCRLLLLAALGSALLASPAHGVGFNGYRGLWYDRAHSGHGLDVEQIGDVYMVVFYTYDASGEPEWYIAQSGISNGVMDTELLHFRYDAVNHRQQQDAVVGHFNLRYDARADDAACAGSARGDASELAVLTANVGSDQLSWCIEPIVPAQVLPETAMNGIWWGGLADAGWGLSSYFIPRGNSLQSVHLIYYYDALNRPRWAYADTSGSDFEVRARWISYRGYCRSCPMQALTARPAGNLSLSLVTPLREPGLGNRIAQTLRYPAGVGGDWNRNGELLRFADAFPFGGTALTREGIVVPDIFLDDSHKRVYYGIPYAAPPTGSNRFRAPQPAPARSRVMPVINVPAGCPQILGASPFGGAPAQISEDCLTLNIWSPQPAATQPLPVMVWIHGGGLIQGSAVDVLPPGGVPVYDGGNFVTQGVIYVSINYRLGPLGFLALPELSAEHSDYPASGNYGFLDQVAALKWVRDNIANFGGDPNDVTIFGESAGGKSVCAHFASPLSRGLFHRGIMESGGCAKSMARLGVPNGTLPAAYEQGSRVAQRLGCAAGAELPACLRGKSYAQIIEAGMATVGFGRSGEQYDFKIDQIAFDRAPGIAMADGSAAAVPLLLGTNQDEATSLVPAELRPTTTAAYEALIRSSFPQPAVADAVLARYPAAAYNPVWRAYTAIVSDIAFICPAQRIARDHAAQGAPTFAYYFTQTSANNPDLGSFHGLEIAYLFNPVSFQNPADSLLAGRMREDWTRFAKSSVPSSSGQVAWPLHPTTGALGLELNGSGDRVVADYRKEYCDFWARYVSL